MLDPGLVGQALGAHRVERLDLGCSSTPRSSRCRAPATADTRVARVSGPTRCLACVPQPNRALSARLYWPRTVPHRRGDCKPIGGAKSQREACAKHLASPPATL